MDIRPGDRVAVNLAPFIGSSNRCRRSVECRVVAVNEDSVEVRTEYPCREVSLLVDSAWIEAEAGARLAVVSEGSG